MMKIRSLSILFSLILISGFGFASFAETSSIPAWVKNNAKWWSEGTIGDTDYISGLQYLVSQGILKIPVKEVIATDTKYNNADVANSFSVTFVGQEGKKTYYSFSRIVETWDAVVRQGSPSLQLEAVPSKDKKDLYTIVKQTYEKVFVGKFDILIDVYSNDGSVINTIKYADCQSTSYWIYVNDNKDHYRFLKTDELEMREVFDFACTGYFINPPAK